MNPSFRLRLLTRWTAAIFSVCIYAYIYSCDLDLSENLNGAVISTQVVKGLRGSPDSIRVHVRRDRCRAPALRARLIGPDLYLLPLAPVAAGSKRVHLFRGDISTELSAGKYQVEVTLMDCGGSKSSTSIGSTCIVTASYEKMQYSTRNVTQPWRWTKICNLEQAATTLQRGICSQGYIFAGSDYLAMDEDIITLNDVSIFKPRSLSQTIHYFDQLSNYELVCWIGDHDAAIYFETFLKLYPAAGSRGQRPFKFKYLKLTNVYRPGEYIEGTETFVKCKILFISLEVDEGISYEAYGQQVETLVGHFQRSHPEPSLEFPAYIITPRSSSQAPNKPLCAHMSNSTIRRWPHQIAKCTEVLHQLVARLAPFDRRVRLLEVSSETETFWQMYQSRDGISGDELDALISATVAFRCLEAIASQVKRWRNMSQIGVVQGKCLRLPCPLARRASDHRSTDWIVQHAPKQYVSFDRSC